MVIVDLAEDAARLSARSGTRAEANVQADLRMLLLAAGLNLREGDLEEVVLKPRSGSAIGRSTLNPPMVPRRQWVG